MVKLSLRDDGMDGTDEEVRDQIGKRAQHIAEQIASFEQATANQIAAPRTSHVTTSERRTEFLNSPNILKNIALAFIAEIGGTIYIDVGANDGSIKSRLQPPSSATHILFGAGLKSENSLKLAIAILLKRRPSLRPPL